MIWYKSLTLTIWFFPQLKDCCSFYPYWALNQKNLHLFTWHHPFRFCARRMLGYWSNFAWYLVNLFVHFKNAIYIHKYTSLRTAQRLLGPRHQHCVIKRDCWCKDNCCCFLLVLNFVTVHLKTAFVVVVIDEEWNIDEIFYVFVMHFSPGRGMRQR